MYHITGKRGTKYIMVKRPTHAEANKTAQALRDYGWTVTISLLTTQGKKVTG